MNKDTLTTAMANFILELKNHADSTHEAEDRPLHGKFLAQAAIIMAKLVQDKPIGDDIDTVERLFGHTWFKDNEAYTKIYSEWDNFKGLITQSIEGMTVNERLFNLGLIEEFDDAIACNDEPRLRGVLFKCFLDDKSAEIIIKEELNKK